MLRINQEEEALEPTPLTNNGTQDDADSLSEEAGTIYKTLDEQLVVTSQTQGQFSYK
jgi:hypothetical protein